MITIQSLLKVADDLVPVEQFTGPIPDEDYVEGALELSIDDKPILTREQVDYVDQLYIARLATLTPSLLTKGDDPTRR